MESIRKKINKIKEAISELENFSISGEELAHECYSEIKFFDIESDLKRCITSVKDAALEELRNNFLDPDKKSYKGKNFVYTVRNGSTRYYFNNVPEVKEAELKYKKSEEFLKYKSTESKYKTAFLLAQKGQSIVDEETGELVDPSNVNVVYSADTITVKPLEMSV